MVVAWTIRQTGRATFFNNLQCRWLAFNHWFIAFSVRACLGRVSPDGNRTGCSRQSCLRSQLLHMLQSHWPSGDGLVGMKATQTAETCMDVTFCARTPRFLHVSFHVAIGLTNVNKRIHHDHDLTMVVGFLTGGPWFPDHSGKSRSLELLQHQCSHQLDEIRSSIYLNLSQLFCRGVRVSQTGFSRAEQPG